MASMRIVRFERFGGPEVLHYQEMPVPQPGEGELLLKVEGAGVNPVDYKIREGSYPAVKSDKLPYVPGRDVAGTVVQVGPGVTRYGEGDRLYAMPAIERGGYAEYVIVREDEAALQPLSIDALTAGAVPLAALTAWQGLFQHGKLEDGQHVLIHGGSGGVGHFAVQFAKERGARVSTTVSGPHVPFARQLGADQVIDYKSQKFEDEVSDVDLVFDLVAGETQDRSWQVLKPGGTLISTLAQPSQDRAAAIGGRGARYTVHESGAELAAIADLIDAGKVRPTVARTFALAEAAAAQQFLETEHPTGKVVLTVS